MSFNPRTRTGCDIVSGGALLWNSRFNPRTRTGCDIFKLKNYENILVSIHAPARGATAIFPDQLLAILFQSTHPHGVRLQSAYNVEDIMRFNPRTRTGCDRLKEGVIGYTYVSIHAPARGATNDMCMFRQDCSVSIHAPARGATKKYINNFIFIIVSIHAPARGATGNTSLWDKFLQVSIHAPARGATILYLSLLRCCTVSIHAPARGATPSIAVDVVPYEFQSTHPHGVRRVCNNTACIQVVFQSTHPHGVRQSWDLPPQGFL